MGSCIKKLETMPWYDDIYIYYIDQSYEIPTNDAHLMYAIADSNEKILPI